MLWQRFAGARGEIGVDESKLRGDRPGGGLSGLHHGYGPRVAPTSGQCLRLKPFRKVVPAALEVASRHFTDTLSGAGRGVRAV